MTSLIYKQVSMFHTFHTFNKRCGRLEASKCAVFPYLPNVPHYILQTYTRVHARTRTRAQIINISSMEGLEGMESPISTRFAAFHTFATGMEGMEHEPIY